MAQSELAFSLEGDEHNGLCLWSPHTGQVRQLTPEHCVYSFCFSPAGDRIAFLGRRPPHDMRVWDLDLWVLDLATEGAEQVTTRFWGAAYHNIAWRPSTNQVAAARVYNRNRTLDSDDGLLPGDGGLWLIDVTTGKRMMLIGSSDSEHPMNSDPRFNSDGSMLACTRAGGYAAVIEVDHPTQWFRLDQPKYMNPDWLMDWVWKENSGTLLLGATAGLRWFGEGQRLRGPGGVWEWNTAEGAAVINLRPNCYEDGDWDETSAKPLFGQAKSIYALAVSHDGKQLAYVTDSGVWVHNVTNDASSQLADREDLPALPGLIYVDETRDAPWARLSRSPDDRYLCLTMAGSGRVRVIDVSDGQVTTVAEGPPWSFACAAWRPRAEAVVGSTDR